MSWETHAPRGVREAAKGRAQTHGGASGGLANSLQGLWCDGVVAVPVSLRSANVFEPMAEHSALSCI